MIILVYGYFKSIEEDKKDIKYIDKNICPKCQSSNIKIIKGNSGSCSTYTIEIECYDCGYNKLYTLQSSNCSIH